MHVAAAQRAQLVQGAARVVVAVGTDRERDEDLVTWIDLTVTGTTWRYADSRTLTDGTYQYQVRVIDNAGTWGPRTARTW